MNGWFVSQSSAAVTWFILAVAPAVAHAGPNAGVRLALDIRAHAKSQSCGTAFNNCNDIVTHMPVTGDYDVRIVLYKYDNVRAIQYGVQWPDNALWEFNGFTSCADLLIGNTSGAPLEVSQTWKTPLIAQDDTSGVTIAVLRLWSDGPGVTCLVPHSDGDCILVVDSTSVAVDTVFVHGCASVEDSSGQTDPCAE